MEGFLRFRQKLNEMNIMKGFQWINGSFFEDVERLRERPPNDIDVVTFYHLPDGITSEKNLLEQNSEFFQSDLKREYKTDAYFVCLEHSGNAKYEQTFFKQILYWYSMWSHQRDTLRWKGYFQIAFDFENDESVGRLLSQLNGESQS